MKYKYFATSLLIMTSVFVLSSCWNAGKSGGSPSVVSSDTPTYTDIQGAPAGNPDF